MTTTYKTSGKLTHPVNDLNAAREFLREHGKGIHGYIYPDEAKPGVHSVTWDLLDDQTWKVVLIADHELPVPQLRLLSEWISGQNSDGLGEGFEQQPFAEHWDEHERWDEEREEAIGTMSSFDWETNPCTLTEVQP